ncbi:hypothetical protein CYY_003501 [Polysphondylium violaceum]|uniref:Uncharacterized protein n=1 Tax=Polysphondylium violaceum TaxID=133409 RepID=A0A8J4UU99_9MYCE|nr:hypothetical protein CYY_003501 [Polysphondylium violaceum]
MNSESLLNNTSSDDSEEPGSKQQQQQTPIDISLQNLSIKEKDEINNYLNIITQQCYSQKYKEVLISTVKLRTYLLQSQIPVIESGVLSRLITFLNCYEFPQLQYESSIILRMLCSTEQVDQLVHLGIIPIFIKLSNYHVKDIRDQVIWGLGNIALQDQYRDIILKAGALDIVLQLVILVGMDNLINSDTDFQRHVAWLLYCFCKERSEILFEIQLKAFPVLYQLIFSSDIEILIHCCLSLKTMCKGSSFYYQQQQQQQEQLQLNNNNNNQFIEIVPRLLELLTPNYIDLHCCIKDTLTILGININNSASNASSSKTEEIPQIIK